jgi:hypothetical protein
MEIIEKIELPGYRYYHLKETDKSYLAEAIFVNRKPRSRVMIDLVKKIEKRVEENKLDHHAYINYLGINKIEEEYCLLRDDEQILTPLVDYLANEEPSLERIVDWCYTLAEIGKQASWSGFNLQSLWIDQKGRIRLHDPEIARLLSGYRGDVSKFLPEEVFMPPEMFRKKVWDETGSIYSLGIVLYYLITGRSPFTVKDKSDLIDEIINTTPVEPGYINHHISIELSNLIMDMLNKKREERIHSWAELLKRLTNLIDDGKIKASQKEQERYKAKAAGVIKTRSRKIKLRSFFRRRWKVLTGLLVAILVVVLLGLTGGTPPSVTKDTPPLQVVEFFYQAINDKDVILLDETTIVDLKRLERMVSETYVIEKMRSVYSVDSQIGDSVQETDNSSLFGIKGLEIKETRERPQPVFTAEYIFYLNEIEEDTEKLKTRELEMKDTIILGNVEGIWQIVELDGSIEKMIQGEAF